MLFFSAHRTDYTWCFWCFSFDNMLSCFLAQNYIFSHKERAGWFFTQLLALHSWLGGWCSGGTKYLHSSQPWGGDLTYPVTRSGCHQSVDILSRDLSSCPGCPGFTSPSCSVSAAALLPLCSQWRLGRDWAQSGLKTTGRPGPVRQTRGGREGGRERERENTTHYSLLTTHYSLPPGSCSLQAAVNNTNILTKYLHAPAVLDTFITAKKYWNFPFNGAQGL